MVDVVTDPVADKLRRALLDLGDTPDAVAAVLDGQGCRLLRTSRSRSTGCPVALYLTRSLGIPIEVGALTAGRINGVRVILPQPVASFVARFDHGEYQVLREDNA